MRTTSEKEGGERPGSACRALAARPVEKVWGRETLPPPFAALSGRRIGEIWFEPPPEASDLLVKYLFTDEKLSVQVHPSDRDAPAGARGKDECWLVVAAEPGARLAVGFAGAVSPEEMRAAALDGSIENLLAWHAVAAGDFFYLPAGTVHAIGAGISLIEVQQNSDLTYRLYDYGRPRDLHLDRAIAIADGGPHPARYRRQVPPTGHAVLVEGPHFRLDRLDGPADAETMARYGDRPLLVLPIDCPVPIGGIEALPGACAVAEGIGAVKLAPGGLVLIAQSCT
ncbi:class I mannose-6-phosphate isomerase [Tsuneonella sp. YG55]|uniref:Class I mannose-6-phosphate isomerase n=1 Tax=Tsuneonella litorea TaxID=2976475 RepID=A0A9X2W3D3_9SPHN|nr:class I mannose-6-phosphate isomerase [Tsuneonella litorea]MCT2559225.1 class I mannose-6-phosphate isomerase [Tsuneonella litorea]